MEINQHSKTQKKVEKIAQAVYLASHHLKDNEPLKWELRKESIALLACARSLSQDSGHEDVPTDMAVDALSCCAHDLISFLSLALVSGLISKNNAGLIISEIESILKVFKQTTDEQAARAGFVLSEEFFSKLDKGQDPDSPTSIPNKSLENKPKIEDSIKDKKDTRQAKIVALLKTRENLTIKDFANIIIDCSEKTIQRELIDLVEQGIVKKVGERRWSTYSLK